MATDSLLQDNPAAKIIPVQGGGAMPKTDANLSGNRKPAGWHSTPVIVPVSANSVEELNSSPLTLKNYKDRWRRTLGPNVPSRHRPRQDPYIVIGSLDITTCPTYVVAPLRGDIEAAKDTLFWTNDLLKDDPKAHVLFMGPLTEGGSRADGDLILKMLESLMSSYPGHVMYVSDDVSTSKNNTVSQLPGSLDGLVLYAMPHTSKQIVFGFIPDEDEVYSSSVRSLDCLEVETVRIPADERTKRKEGERMLTIQFSKAKSSYNRTKQPRSQMVRDNRKWNAPPGWVSQISYQTKDGSIASRMVQEGGKPGDATKDDKADGVKIVLGSHEYKVREPATAFDKWGDGDFTSDEQKLLEENNLKFSNKVYAIFLKGLFNSKCKTLSGAETDPECGGFRYLMSLAYFNKVEQAQGAAPLTVKVDPDDDKNASAAKPVSTGSVASTSAASASAASASAAKPVSTAPVATGPTATGPTTTGPTTTGPTVTGPLVKPVASESNVLDIIVSEPGKPEDKYSVSKQFTQVLVGRQPEAIYTPIKGKFPNIVNPHFINVKQDYSAFGRLQFGLVRKDGVWHIINFGETNKVIGSDKKEIKSWDPKKQFTFDGVKELDQIKDNVFSIGPTTIKIKINAAVDNTLNITTQSSVPGDKGKTSPKSKGPTDAHVKFTNNTQSPTPDETPTATGPTGPTSPTELGSTTNAETGQRKSTRTKSPSKAGESRVAEASASKAPKNKTKKNAKASKPNAKPKTFTKKNVKEKGFKPKKG